MLLSSRTTLMLLDAAEAEGVSRSALVPDGGVASGAVTWEKLAGIVDELARLVDGDPKRLHRIGRRMLVPPDQQPGKRLGLASVRGLYELSQDWFARLAFPHLRYFVRFEHESIASSPARVSIHLAIPEPHVPSASFLRLVEGALVAMPTSIGLRVATVITSSVTARSLDLDLDLPRDRSLLERARHVVRSVRGADPLSVLERERHSLAATTRALERERDELRHVLEALPDLVVIHTGGRILWANQAFMRTLGFTSREHIYMAPLASVVDVQSRALFEERAKVPEDVAMPELTEVSLRTQKGALVRVEVGPTQFVAFQGVRARLVVGRDVTERARLQQQLVAKDRLASLGLLAAGVAHEVNNPLAYVLNNIEMAQKDLARLPSTGPTQELLGVALEGVDRIRVIVRDLLMLARGDGGANAPTDMHSVVESTLTLAQGEIARTARLVRALEPVPCVRAHSAKVGQIVLNLILNALEAMRGHRSEHTLAVRLMMESDRVLLEVKDTGRGISAENLPRVFEPFFTTKPAGLGTGLGLAITQRLVLEVGGEITVDSEPTKGSTFRVWFPVAEQERRTA